MSVFSAPFNLWSYYTSNLYCIDVVSGSLIWIKPIGLCYYSSPVYSDGKLYLPYIDLYGYEGSVNCIDPVTGDNIWVFSTQNAIPVFNPVVTSDSLYVGAVDPDFYYYNYIAIMYCLDKSDGNLTWKTNLTSTEAYYTPPFPLNPAVADDKIYISFLGSTEIICISAQDGHRLWMTNLSRETWGSPSIADERMYIAEMDGRIYAFEDVVKIEKISGGFLTIKTVLNNKGTTDINNVSWNTTVKGGMLGMINMTKTGTLTTLAAGETKTIRTFPLFGLGIFEIDIEIIIPEVGGIKEHRNGFIIGPLVIVM